MAYMLSNQLYCSAVILNWFVDREVVQAAVKGQIIEEDSVECRPEKVSNAIIDDNVDVFLVRKHFSEEAWMIVKGVLQHKKERSVWICPSCQRNLHDEQSIVCESCLNWYHFRCVSLTAQPKKKNWFCRSCHAKSAST